MLGPALLAKFLTDNNITQKVAAKALHVHRPVISLWTKGHVVPQLARRRDIAVWTRDAVPAESWESPEETLRTVGPFVPKEPDPANGAEKSTGTDDKAGG